MKEVITFSPPNSLILVMDYEAGVVPDKLTLELVVATDSCLAIGTLAAPDGETTVTLTDDLEGLEIDELIFDGELYTPNNELSVCNVFNEKLLKIKVPRTSTRVEVFVNDASEPDRIVVFAK